MSQMNKIEPTQPSGMVGRLSVLDRFLPLFRRAAHRHRLVTHRHRVAVDDVPRSGQGEI